MREDFSLQTVIMMPVGLLVLGVILLFAIEPAKGEASSAPGPVVQGPEGAPAPAVGGQPVERPEELIAKISTNKGMFDITLYPKKAPNTVKNFVYLATEGFYNGLTFHRIVHDFLIQGGCPNGDGSGGPGYLIADEISNDLKHDQPGVVSMASADGYAGSQFFITLTAADQLDGEYTIFGKVTRGMDIVEKMGQVETDENERPLQQLRMDRVTILKNGKPLPKGQPMPEVAE